MGWTLTDCLFLYENENTHVHARGNNAAWKCPTNNCHHPILFVFGAQEALKGTWFDALVAEPPTIYPLSLTLQLSHLAVKSHNREIR